MSESASEMTCSPGCGFIAQVVRERGADIPSRVRIPLKPERFSRASLTQLFNFREDGS